MWFKLVPVGFFLRATMCSVFDFSSEFFFQLWGGFCVSVPVCCRAQEAPGTAWSLCVALSHLSWVLNSIFQLLSFISPLSAFLALEPAVLSWVWLLSAVTQLPGDTQSGGIFSATGSVHSHTSREEEAIPHVVKNCAFPKIPKSFCLTLNDHNQLSVLPVISFTLWKGWARLMDITIQIWLYLVSSQLTFPKGNYGNGKGVSVSVPPHQAAQDKEQCAAFPSFAGSQGRRKLSHGAVQNRLIFVEIGKLLLR